MKAWVVSLVIAGSGCAHRSADARLWLGGDVHLGANGRDVLGPVSKSFRGSGVVNLEGPIGSAEAAAASHEEALINGPQVPAALSAAGVVIAGVENNHRKDLPDGAGVSCAALTTAGVSCARNAAAQVVIDGVRVAVTAFDLSAGVPAGLREALVRAREGADALVVTFHVTSPPYVLPPAELEEAVAIALKAGAVVVAAHGSHAVARVERHGGAVVAYGLGNLAFACECSTMDDGLVLEVALDERGALKDAWVVPITAGLQGRATTLQTNPEETFQQLEGLESTPLIREGIRARLSH